MQRDFITNLKPASLAVMVQCIALLLVFLVARLNHWLPAISSAFDLSSSIFLLVFLQAVFSSLLASLAGMAKWWRWIHFGFPITIFLVSYLNIPNEFFLIGFIVTLSLYWTTYRTQVPFYPSRSIIWQQVAGLMTSEKPIRMIDIGSGLGDMSMYISMVRPNGLIEGIEIAPLPWLISVVRSKLKRSAAIFKMGDYRELDFANYDVIFAYLSPAAMPALWQKATAEMQHGSLLLSYEFEILGVLPTQVIENSSDSKKLYVWKIE